MSDLKALSTFMVDIEDMAEERGISVTFSIPDHLFDECWSVLGRFEVGRPEGIPPDLGIQVKEEIGADDIFGGA